MVPAFGSPLPQPCPSAPPSSRSHVSPPSRDIQMPLPVPPECLFHGTMYCCQLAAKSTRGLPGSIATSMMPVLSFTKSTFFHEVPPSVVRQRPRSCCGP